MQPQDSSPTEAAGFPFLLRQSVTGWFSSDLWIGLKQVLFLVWGCGVLLFYGRWRLSGKEVCRNLAAAKAMEDPKVLACVERVRQLLFLDQTIEVRCSDLSVPPFVKGIRRPTLFLPNRLLREISPTDLKVVISHELAHLLRYDLPVHYAAIYLRIVLWFLPPAWILHRNLIRVQDLACDDFAVVVVGSKRKFGEALTRIAEHWVYSAWRPAEMSMFHNQTTLLERLDRFISLPVRHLVRISLGHKCLFALLSLLWIVFSTTTSSALLYGEPPWNGVLSSDSPRAAEPLLSAALVTPEPDPGDLMRFDRRIPFAQELGTATCMDMGDLNGDGYPDLVLGADAGESGAVYLNREGQTFERLSSFDKGTCRAVSAALGDMDRDGDLDLVVAYSDRPNRQYWNDGTGRMTPGVEFGDANYHPECFRLADFDGDGFLDAAEGSREEPARIHFNDGRGRLATHQLFTDSAANGGDYFVVEDIDEDNDPDIVSCLADIKKIWFYKNNSHGRFFLYLNSAQQELIKSPNWLGFGKLDDDDRRDLLVIDNRNRIAHTLRAEEQSGRYSSAGSFALTGGSLSRFDFGDVDRDGDNDLAAGYERIQDQLYLNNGRGGFTRRIPLESEGAVCVGIRLADVDGDGDLDAVAANRGSTGQVYLNDLPMRVLAVAPPAQGLLAAPGGVIEATMTHPLSAERTVRLSVFGFSTGGFEETSTTAAPLIRFTPPIPFHPGETIWATLTPCVSGLAANGTGTPRVWSFRTATGFAPARFDAPAIPFGTAAGKAERVALGDLDRDGDQDIVAGSYKENTCIYWNQGKARFSEGCPLNLDSDPFGTVALGDMDRDGNLDIVVGNQGIPNRIWFNDGNGRFAETFALEADTADHGGTQALALGDVDGDGDLDIACVNNKPPQAEHKIHLNRGDGRGFEVHTVASLQPAYQIALDDTDGDGDLDLLVGNYAKDFYLHPNDGQGRFNGEERYVQRASSPAFGRGDFNGDGRLELAFLRGENNDSGAPARQLVLIDAASPERVLSRTPLPAGMANPADLQSGDADGDGDLDLVAGGLGDAGAWRLFRNDGLGTFTPEALPLPACDGETRLALGDLDGDGTLDLVVVNKTAPNRIFLNPAPPRTDLAGGAGE